MIIFLGGVECSFYYIYRFECVFVRCVVGEE